MADKEAAFKEIQEILKKHNVKFGYYLTFPIYNQLPDEVKLALLVLDKHGVVIKSKIEDVVVSK